MVRGRTVWELFIMLLLLLGMDLQIKLQLGESTNGKLGPLYLADGSPDDHFNVYIYVRVFDSLQSFVLYAITPIQVIRS